MVTHFLALRALAGELDTLFRTLRIKEIFTQQKNEMIISAEPADGGRQAPSIHVSVDPQENYLFSTDETSRARRNSVDIFEETAGSVINGVSIVPFDRTVRIDLRGGRLLLLRLYGSAASNVYLTDRQLTILNAFKNRKRLEGSILPGHELRFDPAILDDPRPFSAAIRRDSSLPSLQALKSILPILGSTFAREALFRAEIDAHLPMGETSEASEGRLYEEVRTMLSLPAGGGARIYDRAGESPIFSVIPLHHLGSEDFDSFRSVTDAVRSFIGQESRSRSLQSEKSGLLERIETELKRTRRSFEAAAASRDPSRPAEYERMGRLIMANIHLVSKGADRIEVADPDPPGPDRSIVSIALNPALTPARNAQEYFKKATKAKSAELEMGIRLKNLARKADVLEELFRQIQTAVDPDELKEIRRKHARVLKSAAPSAASPGEPSLPYREFEVTGGFKVLAGKSSAGNDILTAKYAKPNDLWFHARGASGSHTVLKVGKGQHVPKEAIRAAAAIAAYYSKMRNASNVPVAYCERKYVRKPRGAPPGTVTLEREEIVFVNPRLP